MDADPGSETDRALKALAADIEGTIARLLAEQAELAAEPAPGLTAEDAASVHEFAAEIRDGLDKATQDDRQHLYRILKLRGRVRLDENGVLLGKRHRFEVEWTAAIELRNGDQEYKKSRSQ